MDSDGRLGIQNWPCYQQPLKGNLALQLMSTVAERATKPFLANGGFLSRACSVPDPPVPSEFMRNGWMHQSRDPKMQHVFPMNHSYHVFSEHPVANTLQMFQPSGEKIPTMDEAGVRNDAPSKKRHLGCTHKAPKQKKPKKSNGSRKEFVNGFVRPSRGRNARNASLVINGIDLDISGIPTPVCSCTGNPQPCYRWGIGGWQSACCTTMMSMYPLPMSTKRRGTRIAGRKMTQGAFKKVLEKLTGEGHDLTNPIDLRAYWAKHGTNKFVTIR
ncbi:putative transcription factor GAGA-Binding-like family [Dioscorea sansibarensis]